MSKIKLDISIQGRGFDAARYCYDAKEVISGRFFENQIARSVSEIPGCDGVSNSWNSSVTLVSLSPMIHETWGTSWKEDEGVILRYLDDVVEKLPDVNNYCNGECSRILCVVFLETEDRPMGGFFFSPNLFRKLASLNLFVELIRRDVEM